MQVCPRPGGRRIPSRLGSLRQTSHDAHRHHGTVTIDDGLVGSVTDGLSQRGEDFRGQVDVAVFQIRVADNEIAAQLPTAERVLVKRQAQFVEIGAAFRPNRFGDSSGNQDVALPVDTGDGDMLVQFGAQQDILPQQPKHNLRDQQADIVDCTGLMAGASGTQTITDAAEEVLHLGPLHQRALFRVGHAAKHPSAGSCMCSSMGHSNLTSHFIVVSRLRLRVSRRGVGILSGFLFGQLFLQLCDLGFQLGQSSFVLFQLHLVAFHHLEDFGALLFRLCLVNRFLQFLTALLVLCGESPEPFQFFLFRINPLFQQQSLQCHGRFFLSFHFSTLPVASFVWRPAQRNGRRC